MLFVNISYVEQPVKLYYRIGISKFCLVDSNDKLVEVCTTVHKDIDAQILRVTCFTPGSVLIRCLTNKSMFLRKKERDTLVHFLFDPVTPSSGTRLDRKKNE